MSRDKRKLSAELFSDEKYLDHVDDDAILRLMKNVERVGAEKAAAQFRQRRDKRVAQLEREKQRWEALREKFNGIVIGLDNELDMYGDGFSVRVLMNSSLSFTERKSFVKENRAEFVSWVMHELMESAKTAKRIGDIRFYRPVEMTVLRAAEVELKFEVKAA